MPAGKSRMGRTNPATPGSNSPGEERTSTVAGMSIVVLACTAARMRSHPRNRISATLANPHAHTPRIDRGTQLRVSRVDSAGGKVSGKGWLICIIVNETAGAAIRVAIFWAAGAHCRWLPRVISSANGARNLNDALNHSQWRTWAPFLRKATVRRPAATANTVDCQTWLVNSPIISIHASFLLVAGQASGSSSPTHERRRL